MEDKQTLQIFHGQLPLSVSSTQSLFFFLLLSFFFKVITKKECPLMLLLIVTVSFVQTVPAVRARKSKRASEREREGGRDRETDRDTDRGGRERDRNTERGGEGGIWNWSQHSYCKPFQTTHRSPQPPPTSLPLITVVFRCLGNSSDPDRIWNDLRLPYFAKVLFCRRVQWAGFPFLSALLCVNTAVVSSTWPTLPSCGNTDSLHGSVAEYSPSPPTRIWWDFHTHTRFCCWLLFFC